MEPRTPMGMTDFLGGRGEAIAFARLTKICRMDADLPYFWPHFLGEKCETFDCDERIQRTIPGGASAGPGYGDPDPERRSHGRGDQAGHRLGFPRQHRPRRQTDAPD